MTPQLFDQDNLPWPEDLADANHTVPQLINLLAHIDDPDRVRRIRKAEMQGRGVAAPPRRRAVEVIDLRLAQLEGGDDAA